MFYFSLICTWLLFSGYSYQTWLTPGWLCFSFSQVQLGLGNHHYEASVCANSALGDLHDVGVWNDSVGTNTNSLIQPSVPCGQEFSTGIWDVSSTAFSFQHISCIYGGKIIPSPPWRKWEHQWYLEIESFNSLKCKENSLSTFPQHFKSTSSSRNQKLVFNMKVLIIPILRVHNSTFTDQFFLLFLIIPHAYTGYVWRMISTCQVDGRDCCLS